MSETLLSALFGRGEEPLIRGESSAISANEVLRMAAVIAAELPEATPGSEVAFSFERDRAAFAAALLATWAKGHTAALPEDGTKDNIMPLLGREKNVAFVHDTGVGLGIHVPTLLSEATLGDAVEWTPCDSGQAVLAGYIQTPLQEPEVARWTQEELLAFLADLAEQVPIPSGSHVVSSMTPTAIPGLLLGMLVPALRGATFEEEMARGSEALAAQVREREAQTLVATPAHARALTKLEPGLLNPLTDVWCVDGGLDEQSAEKLRQTHSVEPRQAPRLPLDVKQNEAVAILQAARLGLPFVHDCETVCTHDERGLPDRVLSVLVADEEALEASLAGHGSRPELRVYDSLPRDANGRLPEWRVRLAFGIGRHGATLDRDLEWTQIETIDPESNCQTNDPGSSGQEAEPGSFCFRTRLPEHYAYFEGHYTTYPVLAGAVQIHELALPCIRRIEPAATALTKLSGLKFMSRIAPGDEIEVLVKRGSNGVSFSFEILANDVRCSAGQLQFASAEEQSS